MNNIISIDETNIFDDKDITMISESINTDKMCEYCCIELDATNTAKYYPRVCNECYNKLHEDGII